MDLEKKSVALVGLSGTGKSTVGPLVAQALGMPFVDTDREVEREAGMEVHALFAAVGEPRFRKLESEAVRRAFGRPPSVVSLGGGAVLDPESRRLIWERSVVVWLRAEPEEIARRLSGDPGTEHRPLLQGDIAARLASLLTEREPIYAQAHIEVDTGTLDAQVAAQQVIAAL